jgi:hypothetical protein
MKSVSSYASNNPSAYKFVNFKTDLVRFYFKRNDDINQEIVIDSLEDKPAELEVLVIAQLHGVDFTVLKCILTFMADTSSSLIALKPSIPWIV